MASDRILGQLAHLLGNIESAVPHFEDALTFCGKADFRTELAWSLCDYAGLLLGNSASSARAKPVPEAAVDESRPSTGSGRAGSGRDSAAENRDNAVAMLDEALAISTELGMRPLMERVLARREILNA